MSVDLSQLTAHLSPEQQEAVKKAYRKQAENPTTAFLWCFFFGTFGAHRFYLRQWGAGLARLIFPVVAIIVIVLGIALQWPPATIAAIVIPLLLIALVWEVIDLFRIDHQVYERNLKLAEQLIASALLTDHSVEDKALGRMEFLMEQTAQASSAAAAREEQQTATEAAAAAPEPVAAVSEAEPAIAAPTGESAETLEARETESAGAGVAEAQYVASTVSEISATPGEPEHAAPAFSPEHNWSEAALVHTEGEAVETGERAGEETVSEPGALGAAAVGVGMAAVGGAAVDELVTRSHEETDHSATDSLETFTTLGVAESEAKDEVIAAEAEAVSMQPPTTAEAEALTWPDHPPVSFDKAPAGAVLREDVTDMGMALDEAAPPVADVEGAAPLFVSLAGLDAVTSPDMPAAPQTDAESAPDDAILLLVPDEAAETAFEAEPLSAMEEAAAPPESYIPPTVPVVSVPETAEPAPADSGPMLPPPLAPEVAPEPESVPHEERLAELAGLAGGVGLAAGAAEMIHAHHEPEPEPVSAAPVMKSSVSESSAAPAPAEEPVMPSSPVAEEGVSASAAEAAPAEPPRRKRRRVREYLQVKRGDQIEELMAEELIELDEDPEPVRLRLRADLHQRAVDRGLE